MRTSLILTSTVVLSVIVMACSSSGDDHAVCAPGETQSCLCAGGRPGAQVCRDDGSGWEPCNCEVGPTGDAGDAAADGSDVGLEDIVDADLETRVDTRDTRDTDSRAEVDAVGDADGMVSDVVEETDDSTQDADATPQDADATPQDAPQDADTTAIQDAAQDTSAPDLGQEVCTTVTCIDYVTCQSFERCAPCPDTPEELCNGKDDDCDGVTDDDGEQLDCPPGETCRGGICCADECDMDGLKECVGTLQVRTCGNYDEDGCLEWSLSDCDPATVCSGGSCSCTPETCASLGYDCGTWSDGCGASLDCGACGPDETCELGHCQCTVSCGTICCKADQVCRYDTCCDPHDHQGCEANAMYWFDSCDNREDKIDDCDGGEVCYDNACCLPATCSPGMCGTNIDDGCGGTIDCGDLQGDENNCGACGRVCGPDETCSGGLCCCGGTCKASGEACAEPAKPNCIGGACVCSAGTVCGENQTCNSSKQCCCGGTCKSGSSGCRTHQSCNTSGQCCCGTTACKSNVEGNGCDANQSCSASGASGECCCYQACRTGPNGCDPNQWCNPGYACCCGDVVGDRICKMGSSGCGQNEVCSGAGDACECGGTPGNPGEEACPDPQECNGSECYSL